MTTRDGGADLISDATVALAASQNSDGDVAAVYCAVARMRLVQLEEAVDVLRRGVAAREAELARLAKIARGSKG